MSDNIDEIFAGDALGRRDEAELILSVIDSELEDRKKRNRSEAYILALDAAYGEGKTWFLERLREFIALYHPVAFVDAWADDADGEPLTAFMAAIEDALSPYLSTGKALREHLTTARHAALPILGRAAVGAVTKIGSKLMGEGIDDAFGDAIEDAASAGTEIGQTGGALADGAAAGIDRVGDGIVALVDRRGETMLADYRKRQRSRQAFRSSMERLVGSISGPGEPPLFIVIDELDRCRPDYAIRVLEEIKHFFSVPNVVFIIALHGDQLAESVNAIYGSGFKSREYLQRFFTRRYRLRRLPPNEIISAEVKAWNFPAGKFRLDFSPFSTGQDENLDVAKTLSWLLFDMNVGPRETIAVLDLVRFFARHWVHRAPITPLFLVPLAVAHVRKADFSEVIEGVAFSGQITTHDPAGRQTSENVVDVIRQLRRMSKTDLSTFNWENHYTNGDDMSQTGLRRKGRSRS